MVFLERQCSTGHVCTQSQTLTPFHSFLSKHSVCACLLGHSVVSGSVAHQAPLSMDFPSKSTGVGCRCLLQGIFLTQGLNLRLLWLLHWQVDFFYFIFLPLSHLGSPSKVKVKSLSHVQLFVTLWTVAYQDPPSTGFSRQEYWSGLPLPSPGDLPDPGIEPWSPALQADALPSEPAGKQRAVTNGNFWYIVAAVPCLCVCVCKTKSWFWKVAGIHISQLTPICRIPGLRILND